MPCVYTVREARCRSNKKVKKCMHNEGPHMESTCLASVKVLPYNVQYLKSKAQQHQVYNLKTICRQLCGNHTPCRSGALLLLGVLHHAQLCN
jgi:hypothetical protein